MKKMLITGASGFVGRPFLDKVIAEQEYTPIIAVRRKIAEYSAFEQLLINDLSKAADWSSVLQDTQVVVHIAGRAHIMHESTGDSQKVYRAINTEATLALAKQALNAGVKRFIFISSISVNGQTTTKPFTEQDKPNPQNDYAISKYEAELALQKLTANTTMELVIIRPPLVYGADVKANFLSLLKWVKRGIPLPLGCVKNKRSFISVTNLVDFIYKTLDHPHAANQLFLIADDEEPSTPQLLRMVAHYMDKKILLLPAPICLLRLAARLVGKQRMAMQLCDSLEVDNSKAKNLLDWEPSLTLDQAIQQTVASFMEK